VVDYQLSLSRVCIVIIPQSCSIAKVLCYINLEQSCERWTLCKVPTDHHTYAWDHLFRTGVPFPPVKGLRPSACISSQVHRFSQNQNSWVRHPANHGMKHPHDRDHPL
jgi:hypothetical protein